MGITPIVNLAPFPLTRAIEKELEPLPMERVENTARSGDETYSPSNQKSAQGGDGDRPKDDGSPEEEFPNLAVEDEEQLSPEPAAESPTRRISFLA
jgi:hypothetical protein